MTCPDIEHSSQVASAAPLAPIQKKHHHEPQIDALLLAYMYIFQSVQTSHETAQIQAKGIAANASAQNRLIAREAGFNFCTGFQNQVQYTWKNKVDHHKGWFTNPDGSKSWLTWTTTRKVLTKKKLSKTEVDKINDANQKLQAQNQEISALRGMLEDQLNVLRQNSQIKQTNLNSTVDEGQQSLQQGSGLLQMLTQLTNQISRI